MNIPKPAAAPWIMRVGKGMYIYMMECLKGGAFHEAARGWQEGDWK